MKLDIGSGPKEFWFKPEEKDWIRLDCEEYEGVTHWVCPEKLPAPDNSVEEAYVGQFLIETSPEEHKALAKELVRVMRPNGVIRVHCYGMIATWTEFVKELEKSGWVPFTEELVNVIEREGDLPIRTYMSEIRKLR